MSKYTRWGTLSLPNVFPDGPETGEKFLKRSKAYPTGRIVAPSKSRGRSRLIRKIFCTFFDILMRRVADGDTFILPGSTGSTISLEAIPDNEVKKLRQAGKYTEIDIIKSNFKIPRFILSFGPNRRATNAQIHVPTRIRDIAFRNAEEGKLSYVKFRKT